MMSQVKQSYRDDSTDYWICREENNHRVIQCEPFCSCNFPKKFKITEYTGQIADLCDCRCGEDDPDTHQLQWLWYQHNDSNVIITGQNITFHPTYSSGTAIIRGDKPLEAGMVHFWEIRLITVTYGTDVMFGIGTDKVDLTKYKFHFISALGIDAESWGLSYTGKFLHNNMQTQYVNAFSQGCILGICLDRSRGTLEYYLNRRPLGIVSHKIPIDNKVKIYPMVSSTTARSCIRLINAISPVDCLQLRAFQAFAKQKKSLDELRKIPGFKRIINRYWFLDPPVRYSKCNPNDNLHLLDEAVLSSSLIKSHLTKKDKYKDESEIASQEQHHMELDPLHYIYRNLYSDDLYTN